MYINGVRVTSLRNEQLNALGNQRPEMVKILWHMLNIVGVARGH